MKALRIGLISDTHGLLRPEAVEFLRGCQHLIHAGDIGDESVIRGLEAVAPTTAIRGNNDQGPWAQAIPETAFVEIGEIRIHMLHDLAQLEIDPVAAGVSVVVSGHSHKPRSEERDGVLYINPGSAGPRRFSLPIAVAELTIVGTKVTPRLVDLVVAVPSAANRAKARRR